MTRTKRPGLDSARGFVTVQYVAAVALSLVVFTMLAEVIVLQYTRAVIRAAADEGVRAGSRVTQDPDGGEHACEARIRDALDDLLTGTAGRNLDAGCTVAPRVVHARIDGIIEGWLPVSIDHRVNETARSVRERVP